MLLTQGRMSLVLVGLAITGAARIDPRPLCIHFNTGDVIADSTSRSLAGFGC
jgi:hypothetical protein